MRSSQQENIPYHTSTSYEGAWAASDANRHIPIINDLLDDIVSHIGNYVRARQGTDPDLEYTDPREFKTGVETLAYSATERLAQVCGNARDWTYSDKARFLSPTVDFMALVMSRLQHAELPSYSGYIGVEDMFAAIQFGSWDFLQVAERTQSWFEALNFNEEEVAYLLWAAHKTVRLLGGQERIPGFTPLVLTDGQVLSSFCNCESPIESVLYMQLVVDGLGPPDLRVQHQVEQYRLDMAIPDAVIAVECNGAKYHDEEADAERDEDLRTNGWIVLRFPARKVLDFTEGCSIEVRREYQKYLEATRGRHRASS